jgi:hypothetical protein
MAAPPPPPGWYPDPTGKPGQMYWDGQAWQSAIPATTRPAYAPPQRASDTPPPTRSKRIWLIALVAVLLIAGAGVVLRNVLSSKATGGELVLTGATDPGANAFMPAAASPPPTSTQPPPTLQPQGDGNTLATQPLPGDRDGLYGGTDNNAEVDRDKIADFLSANPPQANSFVESLNSDTTIYWSGGNHLTVADVPRYLHELTPAVLRLDTRITDHGFDGTHPTARQSVFQAGDAVLVDAQGVPRVRGLSGNPLTAPVALRGAPKLFGAPWPGYHAGALAEVRPTTAPIGNFVLVDVVTGQPFNRPAGTTGGNDTPHTEPVASPAPATSAPPTTGQTPQRAIDGTYHWRMLTYECGGTPGIIPANNDSTIQVTQQGNTVNFGFYGSATLNADGSFETTWTTGPYTNTMQGVFATEGDRTVIRDGVMNWDNNQCRQTYSVATKQ